MTELAKVTVLSQVGLEQSGVMTAHFQPAGFELTYPELPVIQTRDGMCKIQIAAADIRGVSNLAPTAS